MPRVRGAERRREILEQALAVFSERGYRDGTLDEIAARLGLTRQAFFYYFKSKEEILWSLVEALGFELLEQARPIAEGSRPAGERLHTLVERHVLQLLRNRAAFIVYFADRDRLSEEKSQTLRQGEHEYAELVARVIADGQCEGVFVAGNPLLHALLVLGVGNSVLRWYRPGGPLGVDGIAGAVADFAIGGIRRSPVPTTVRPSADGE